MLKFTMVSTAALAAIVLSGCSPTTQVAQKFISERFVAPYAEIAVGAQEQGYIDQQMSQTLRDSRSAQYQGIRAATAQFRTGGTSVVICGMVNATNGYGGFTGFKPFFIEAIDGKAEIIHDVDGIYAFCQAANIPIG